MFSYYLPFCIAVTAAVAHAIFAKAVPQKTNTWLSLTATYGASAIFCLLLFFATAADKNIIQQYQNINVYAALLGFAVIGLEFGFIEMYKKGWPVSQAGLLTNSMAAVLLVLIGFFAYKEQISLRQLIGIVICIIGMFMVKSEGRAAK